MAALSCLLMIAPAAAGIEAPSGEDIAVEGDAVTLSWSPPPPAHTVIQTGCSATDRAMGPLAEAFMDENPLIAVELEGGTNDLAFSQWIAGLSDIAQASRGPDPAESARAEEAGREAVDIVVGAETVAVVLSPGLGVEELTVEQLRGLYNGNITSWAEVGGPDRPVELVGTPDGTSAYSLVRKEVLLDRDFAPMEQREDGEVAEEVRERDGAIGILLSGLLPSGDEDLVIAIADGDEAVLPFDPADSFSSTYPLARTFHLITDGPPEGAEGTWMDFILAPDQGQRLLVENGFLAVPDELREEGRAKVTGALDGSPDYRVYRSHGGTEEVFETAEPRFVDSEPPAGTEVTYTVTAVVDGEESERSADLTVRTPEPPAAPGQEFMGIVLPFAAAGGIAAVGLLVWTRRRR